MDFMTLAQAKSFANQALESAKEYTEEVVSKAAIEGAGVIIRQEVIAGDTNPVSGDGVKNYVDFVANQATELIESNKQETNEQFATLVGELNATFNRLPESFVEQEVGKGLSTNDFTDDYKNQLNYLSALSIDTEMSDTSTNPVQNKVVKAYIDSKAFEAIGIEVDKEVKDGSINPVSGGAVKEYVDSKVQDTGATLNGIVEPMLIQGAVVENFYNPTTADKQEGIFIDYAGEAQANSDYCVIKVKLFSGKTYRLNATAYSAAIYEDDNIYGTVKYNWLIGSAQKIKTPDTIEDKIVTVFFCFKNTSYKENLIIVLGEELPTGDELYRISYPWLYIPEEEKEEENTTLPPYTVNEISLKQKMPPHLFDGIEMDNYFDADYMIANATQDPQYTKYWHTPYIYLPAGTYTINECYKYTQMSKDGVKGTEMSSGGVYNMATFTVTEENPYISFMIYCVGLDSTGNALTGIDYLRKISIQKGETATTYIPNTYRFNEKFNFKGSIGFYPTHWDCKKFATIGDSITFGTPSGVTPEDGTKISPNFAEIVSGNLNMELLNTAQPGATVKDALGVGRSSYNNQVEQIINFAPNVVTIMLGVNDASSATKVPLGTIDDVYDATNITFYAGLGEIVNQIQTALPSTTIILMSSPKNKVTANMTSYFNAVEEVAEKYNVLFCDLYNICGFNLNNEAIRNEFAIVDGQVHPNYKAHKVIGSRLTGFIASH